FERTDGHEIVRRDQGAQGVSAQVTLVDQRAHGLRPAGPLEVARNDPARFGLDAPRAESVAVGLEALLCLGAGGWPADEADGSLAMCSNQVLHCLAHAAGIVGAHARIAFDFNARAAHGHVLETGEPASEGTR